MSSIDYSKYTLNELIEVKDTISSDSPNYGALLTELENRKSEFEEATNRSPDHAVALAENRVKVIGYFQIAGAVVLSFIYLYSIWDGTVSLLSTAIVLPIIVLNVLAGLTALKEIHRYYWLSILNQSIQIPSIELGNIAATYSGLGGAHVFMRWDSEVSFGASALFSPGVSYEQFIENLQTQSISIDIIAIIFVCALLTAKTAKSSLHTG